MPYSSSSDLLTGNIPLPPYIDSEKVVADAADEIDSYIGFRYVTPVVLDNLPENRPAVLLLKRINNHLATGRLLMEVASAQEDTQLHAYAKRLVDESLLALVAIRDGELLLGDAPILPGNEAQVSGPLHHNHDPISQVDTFYDEVLFAPPRLTYYTWPD